MKTTTLPIKHSLNRSRCPLALLFIPFVLVCFALAPSNDAQCPQICDSTYQNTAVGDSALIRNTTGANNTAIGFNVLEFNTTGGGNTATGFNALGLNTFGNSNTASGSEALGASTTGDTNTATGLDTLLNSTTGNGNTATGFNALSNNTTGNNNIALGAQAGTNITTGSSNIDIGNNGVAGESRTIRIGKRGLQTATYIAAISGATVPTGVAVIVDVNGHLGRTTSSARSSITCRRSFQPSKPRV